MRLWLRVLLIFCLLIIAGCQVASPIPAKLGPSAHLEVIGTPLPHDSAAFTQGLLVKDARFYESTGLKGRSELREVEISTGKVTRSLALDPQYFGEGLAYLDGRFFQLTWLSKTGFVYDAQSLDLLTSFEIPGEGWGLTSDGHALIYSDGSATLTWLEPQSFAVLKTLQVSSQGKAVPQLNELEYIDGFIYANVFMTDLILRIDPESGEVLTIIDAAVLRPESTKADLNSVLNGIAWDAASKSLYLTGKNWPLVYKVRIVDGPAPARTKQP